MAFFISDTDYQLSQASVNTTTGEVTDLGPLNMPNLTLGDVVVDSDYDPALPGWRLLIAHPVNS